MLDSATNRNKYIKDNLEIILVIISGFFLGAVLSKNPFVVSGLFLVLLFCILYQTATDGFLKTSFFISFFWIIYSNRSTIFSGISIPEGLFYPLYLIFILIFLINLSFVLKNMPKENVWVISGYACFLLFILVGIINIEKIPENFRISKKLFTYFLPAIICFQFISIKSLNAFVSVQILVSAVLSLWIIGSNLIAGGESYRGGIDVNANYVAAIISIGLIGIIFRLIKNKNESEKNVIKTFFYLGATTLGLYSLFILGSRGVTTALLLSASVLLFSIRTSLKRKLSALFAFATFVIVIMLLPGSGNLFSRFSDTTVTNLNARMPIWTSSLKEFGNWPLLDILVGKGVGSSRIVVSDVNPTLASTHNGYIQILLEFGLIGFFLFLLVILLCFYSLRATGNSLSTYGCALLAFFAVSSLAASPDSFIFWILLGQIFAIGGLRDET